MSVPPPGPPVPRPRDGEPPLREGYRSGVVVVVLADRPGADAAPDLLAHAREQGLVDLAELLAGADLPAEPAIARDRVGRVRGREERARGRNPARTDRSLALYWRVDALGVDGDLDELARRFAAADGVQLAYAEQAVVAVPPAPVRERAGAPAAPAVLAQGHLDPAPVGVGARGVRGLPGGTGAGVRVVDVEQGWHEAHPALAGFAFVADPPRVNRDGHGAHVGTHGTEVVAVLAAAAGVPVVGVGEDLEVLGCSHWDGVARRGYNVAAAVDRALDLVDPGGGDVVLLEVQRHDADGRELPTEIDRADLDALTLARDLGTLVVEAAGNGDRSLDTWTDPATGRTLAEDSGAVVVGASASACDGTGHARWTTAVSGSNHGARVDCHAWGEDVATATVVDGRPEYTAGFGGTSAAAAVVAGVAAVVQAMHRRQRGGPLDPAALRDLLRTHGTPQSPPAAPDPVGVLPDLARLAAAVAPGALPDGQEQVHHRPPG